MDLRWKRIWDEIVWIRRNVMRMKENEMKFYEWYDECDWNLNIFNW